MWELCQKEIAALLPGSSMESWIKRGVGITSVPDADIKVCAERLQQAVFLRHIFPLQYTTEISEADGVSGIAQNALAVLREAGIKRFSVQVRVYDESPNAPNKTDTARMIAERISAEGYTEDVKDPEMIVSVVVQAEKRTEGQEGGKKIAYTGVSDPKDNLSAWAGGMRRYQNSDERISRAEFKLLEAIEVFGLDLDGYRGAIDLGAAPGGWSRILALNGLNVHAVDPANLDKRLKAHNGIRHMQETAQEYLLRIQTEKDRRAPIQKKRNVVLVNDMRMDVMESVGIVCKYAQVMRIGRLIMTFKLPEQPKKIMTIIDRGVEALSEHFSDIKVKQLFHNRSEVTVTGTMPE